MTDLRDKIARALSSQTTCDGEPHPSELHYRQADAVLATLDLDKVRAEAWEAGYRSGHSRAMRLMSDEPSVEPGVNPYRKAEQ